MSTRRYDPPQHAQPLGSWHRIRRGDAAHAAWEDRLTELKAARLEGSFLSVVVAAKNEAPSLPQLVEEIARLCGLCVNALLLDWENSRSCSLMTVQPTKPSKFCCN